MRNGELHLSIIGGIIFLLFSFFLFPDSTVKKELLVFDSFDNFVKNIPSTAYLGNDSNESDKLLRDNPQAIKVINEKTLDGRLQGKEVIIPRDYRDRYFRLNEYGFKEHSTTKKMIAAFNSLDNLFKKKALNIYKTDSCETDYYNDTILKFKHIPNLIKVTYFYNRFSDHIYLTIHHIPHSLLATYLKTIISVGSISPTQAEQVKLSEANYLTLKYDYLNRFIDAARERELEIKYNRKSLAADTAAPTEQRQFTSYYLHRDSSGSITAITDQDGKLIERVEYSPYGYPTFWDYTQDPNNPVKRSRSVIGNNILFHGREYDYDLNLYYFRNRYYDPIMGRFLQTDPLGYQNSMNLYQAFHMNPVNFNDPFGLEPVRKYAGIVPDIVNAMNNSPSKIGLKKGQLAIKALLYLGESELNWDYIIPHPVPANTPYFNWIKGRYIYTKKGGWIDMGHFLFYAGRAYRYKIDKERVREFMKSGVYPHMPGISKAQTAKTAYQDPAGEAMQDGYMQEKSDTLLSARSAYSYEDLPSDKFGIIFALKHFDPNSNLTLSEQVANFLNTELWATIPESAPNWSIMPKEDTGNPPSRTNKTTTPVYTSEEIQKINQFIKWLESLLE